jgi:hypothetical protein
MPLSHSLAITGNQPNGLVVGSRTPPLSSAAARLAASHDQLQMQLVPLLGLLRQTKLKARKRAVRSGLYFLAA